MNIQKANVNDAEVISKIHASSWKTAYNKLIPQAYLDALEENFWESSFTEWISENQVTVQIMYESTMPIGCIAYGKARDVRWNNWGEIISIYFIPSFMGKSYGKHLLQFALADMQKQDYVGVYLWVLKGNKFARAFYEKNGFVLTKDTCSFEILEEPMIDVRYAVCLNNFC